MSIRGMPTVRLQYNYLFQRALAAILAILLRLLADSFLALDLRPFGHPIRPRSTAGESLIGIAVNEIAGPSRCSPMAFSTTRRAKIVKSRPSGLVSVFLTSPIYQAGKTSQGALNSN